MSRTSTACPICGSPDRECAGGHASNVSVVDVPKTGTRPAPADCLATATINGHLTTIRTTRAEAAANGWPIVGEDAPEDEPDPTPKTKPKTKPRTPTRTKPRTPAKTKAS